MAEGCLMPPLAVGKGEPGIEYGKFTLQQKGFISYTLGPK
jgi:hypothetical protein